MKTSFAIAVAAKGLLLGWMIVAMSGSARAQSFREASLLDVARQSERFGKHADASRLYREVIALNPNNQEALHRLGVVAAAEGDMKQAIAHFAAALNCGSPSAQLLSDYGGALFLNGEIEQAEQKLRAALTMDPNHRDAHNNLALLTAQRYEQSAAAEHLAAAANARQDAQAAERARRIAEAWAEREGRAATKALANARAASSARKIAEAYAVAESQAAAKAMEVARAAIKEKEMAEAKIASVQQERDVAAHSGDDEGPSPPLPRRHVVSGRAPSRSATTGAPQPMRSAGTASDLERLLPARTVPQPRPQAAGSEPSQPLRKPKPADAPKSPASPKPLPQAPPARSDEGSEDDVREHKNYTVRFRVISTERLNDRTTAPALRISAPERDSSSPAADRVTAQTPVKAAPVSAKQANTPDVLNRLTRLGEP